MWRDGYRTRRNDFDARARAAGPKAGAHRAERSRRLLRNVRGRATPRDLRLRAALQRLRAIRRGDQRTQARPVVHRAMDARRHRRGGTHRRHHPPRVHRPIGSTGMGWAVMSLSRMERAWVTRRERYGRGGRGKPYVGRPTHGFSKTPTYKSWDSAKQRCTNPADDHWPDYGGRGIGMCARWLQ